MKEILLTQGKITFVDDIDFEWLSQWKWFANKYRETFYAVRSTYVNKRRGTVLMHRAILGLLDGDKRQCDHRDMNGLNNQRENLRIATHSQNKCNTRIHRNNRTGFKGVSSDGNQFVAEIQVDYKHFRLGRYSSASAASEAYRQAAKKLHGEFAAL